MQLQEIKNKVLPVLHKHHITRAGIFGSCAKNIANEKSDIDILVELGMPITLLQFVAIKNELEDMLGKKVDLVEYQSLKPRLKEKILNEQVIILSV